MKKWIISAGLFFALTQARAQSDSAWIASVYNEALTNGECYANLRVLCKDIGHRLAGSASADKAIAWSKQLLQNYGFDTVFLMPVQVPHWVRGNKELFTAFSKQSGVVPVRAVALGGSVGSNGVISAEIVEVKSLSDIEKLGEEGIKGKIVFINKPLDPVLINTGAAYGGAYDARGKGPSVSARYGAVGCIIRSLTTAEDGFPHTGATDYQDSIPKIPAMALSSVDARWLSEQLRNDPAMKCSMELDCQLLEPVTQYNVIGQIDGSVFPEKYIVVGGHLDSWDIGEGAHDDGAGVMQSVEVLRTLKAIGYRPKHSVRCVLYINEEFGNDGGKTYAAESKRLGWKHAAAIESDGGGFSPKGFAIEGGDVYVSLLKSWAPLFERYELYSFKPGWSGVDIGPLRAETTPLFGLKVDPQRYFDYHHSANDRFENVNNRELTLGAAAMTSLVILLDQHLPAVNP